MLDAGIVYGLIATLGFGLASGISRNVSRAVGGPKSVFMKTLFGVLTIFVLLAVLPQETYTAWQCMKIFLLGMIGYIPLVSFYKSLQYGDIGVMGPLANTSSVFTILLSIIFLGEHVSGLQWVAIILIIAGAVFLGLNLRGLQNGINKKAIIYVTIAALGRGCMYFMFDQMTDVTGPVITALYIEAGVLCASILHCFFKKQSLRLQTLDKKVLRAGIMIGVLANIGGVALNYGFAVATVPVVAAVFACSPLVSSLYGVLVYKERLGLQEWISIFSIIVGLILLAGIV